MPNRKEFRQSIDGAVVLNGNHYSAEIWAVIATDYALPGVEGIAGIEYVPAQGETPCKVIPLDAHGQEIFVRDPDADPDDEAAPLIRPLTAWPEGDDLIDAEASFLRAAAKEHRRQNPMAHLGSAVKRRDYPDDEGEDDVLGLVTQGELRSELLASARADFNRSVMAGRSIQELIAYLIIEVFKDTPEEDLDAVAASILRADDEHADRVEAIKSAKSARALKALVMSRRGDKA